MSSGNTCLSDSLYSVVSSESYEISITIIVQMKTAVKTGLKAKKNMNGFILIVLK